MGSTSHLQSIILQTIRALASRGGQNLPDPTKPIHPTPIRANLEQFLAYSGSNLSKPGGSVRVSGIRIYFLRVPDPPRLNPPTYKTKKNPKFLTLSLYFLSALFSWFFPLSSSLLLSLRCSCSLSHSLRSLRSVVSLSLTAPSLPPQTTGCCAATPPPQTTSCCIAPTSTDHDPGIFLPLNLFHEWI